MKRTTISELYFLTLISYIFILLSGIAGSIIVPIFSDDLVSRHKIWSVILIVIVIAFIIIVAFSLKTLIVLLRDYKAVKSKNYITIIAKVIKFKKNRDPESGLQINDNPVVMIVGTNQQIALIINDRIKIGETYRFNYLKYSKIAEVVEKIEDARRNNALNLKN